MWTRTFLGVRGGANPPRSGRKKPPQKNACVLSGFCQSGIVTSLLLQFQFLRRPASAGFLFIWVWDFLQVVINGEPASGNRSGSSRVCPNISGTASAIQLASVVFELYNYDQRIVASARDSVIIVPAGFANACPEGTCSACLNHWRSSPSVQTGCSASCLLTSARR
jgi:hypothetical protein